jgi:ankyrin repeat protein
MPSLRDLFAGVRNTFSRGAQQESHDDVDLSEPSIDAPRVEDQRRPLYAMVRENKLDDLKAAFDQDADLSTTNMLHNARSPEMVDFLVGKGGDVNQYFDNGPPTHDDQLYGPTPLMRAAYNANAETVQRLIHHGANPDDCGLVMSGDSPLHDAIRRKDDQQEAVVRTLLEAGATFDGPFEETILPHAVHKGATVGTIRALLEHGADADEQDTNLMSGLHFAADDGRGDVADLLLDYGAGHQRNIEGYTPLHLAAFRTDMDMVNKLVSRGADPAGMNSLISERNTVLTVSAVEYRDLDLTKKLLDNGADPKLAMAGSGWKDAEENASTRPSIHQPQEEAMHLVRTYTVEKEKAALRQTFADVEQEQAHDVAEQPTSPVARRRVRL